MKHFVFLLSLLNTICIFSQEVNLYVGTYTINTDSEGIYKYTFNQKTGELSNKKLTIKTVNPSFLALTKKKNLLFTVSENGKKGIVKAYSKANENTFNFIYQQNSNGAGPCHIQLNKKENQLAVSNYGGGSATIYRIEKTGKINNSSQTFNHNLKKDKAHAHSAKFYKNNLFIADLGRDFLAQYTINSEGNYSLKDTILMKDNAGPRHFEISKKGKFIYVINELNSTVSVLKNSNNNFTTIQNISTLKANYSGKNSCADIHLSKNNKFLYGSNRGENSIAVFKVNKQSGKLEKIQNISVEGNWPRNFTLSPNGKFLLVANQKSNNISIFKIDKKSGKLSFIKDYKQASPVCLVF